MPLFLYSILSAVMPEWLRVLFGKIFAGQIVICKGQGTGRVGLVKETRMTEHG